MIMAEMFGFMVVFIIIVALLLTWLENPPAKIRDFINWLFNKEPPTDKGGKV